jgi:hypothetical protein
VRAGGVVRRDEVWGEQKIPEMHGCASQAQGACVRATNKYMAESQRLRVTLRQHQQLC